MSRVPKVDWVAVREEFVAGGDDVTHVALGKKYHVERQTVTRHASKEGWNAQRTQFRHQVTKQTRERTSAHEAKLRADQIKTAAALRALAVEQLDKLRRPGKRMVKGPDGKEVEQATPSLLEGQLDAAECRRYLRTAAQIENQALGIEAEVRITAGAEVEEILRRLKPVLGLTDEEYERALGALSPGPHEKVLDVLPLPSDRGKTPS